MRMIIVADGSSGGRIEACRAMRDHEQPMRIKPMLVSVAPKSLFWRTFWMTLTWVTAVFAFGLARELYWWRYFRGPRSLLEWGDFAVAVLVLIPAVQVVAIPAALAVGIAWRILAARVARVGSPGWWCARCGYELRVSDQCSECGSTAPISEADGRIVLDTRRLGRARLMLAGLIALACATIYVAMQ